MRVTFDDVRGQILENLGNSWANSTSCGRIWPIWGEFVQFRAMRTLRLSLATSHERSASLRIHARPASRTTSCWPMCSTSGATSRKRAISKHLRSNRSRSQIGRTSPSNGRTRRNLVKVALEVAEVAQDWPASPKIGRRRPEISPTQPELAIAAKICRRSQRCWRGKFWFVHYISHRSNLCRRVLAEILTGENCSGRPPAVVTYP